MADLRRFGASLITPFTPDGALCEDALAHQARRVHDAGLGVWLASSGTGEGNTLSADEIDRIAEVIVSELGSRADIVAMGTEPRTAQEVIDFARRMSERGITTVQVGPLDPGHSFLPDETLLRAFFEEVLESIEVGCVLASHMSVGYDVPPALFADLQNHPTVEAIAVTQLRDYPYLPGVLSAVDRVPVVVGSPVHMLDALAMGANGVVSSMDANVAPTMYRDFERILGTDDFLDIATAATRISDLFLKLLRAGGVVVVKAVLDELGLAAGPPRTPRLPPTESHREAAQSIISEFDLVL